MSLKYKQTQKSNDTNYLVWLLLIVSLVGAFLFRNDESTAMLIDALDIAGPTLPFLVFLIAYMLTIYWRVLILNQGLDASRLADIFHAEDMGDIAATLGLIGTVIAMVSSASAGEKLDVTTFLQSLISTLIGISAYAVSKFISSIFERELTRRQSHKEGSEHV